MEIVSYAMGEGAGYDEGYTAGEESSTAYQDGYTAGETAGYASGYSAGYDEGVASVNSVKALIDARGAAYLFATKIGNTNLNAISIVNDGVLKNILKFSDMYNQTDMSYMFYGQYKTKEFPSLDTSNVKSFSYTFADCFTEGGNAPILNTSNALYISGMFSYGYPAGSNVHSNLKTIPLYDFKKVTSARALFFQCSNLEVIPALNFQSISTNATSFNDISSNNGWIRLCYNLREIHIVDIHYSINITASTAFTREALNEIIGNLRDMTGSTALTLTMGATNLAKLTAEDIAVATDKNWTIA